MSPHHLLFAGLFLGPLIWPDAATAQAPLPGQPYRVPLHMHTAAARSLLTSDGGHTWRLVNSGDGRVSVTPRIEGPVRPDRSMAQSHAVPNPASVAATIRCRIPVQGRVVLKMIDLQGKPVLHVDHGIKGEGEHLLEINASLLQTGFYSFTIVHNDRPHAHGTLVVAR
jgi:hypothetical protein